MPRKSPGPTQDRCKPCTSCKQEKHLSEFARQAKGLFGHTSKCKQCYRSDWLVKRSEKIDECRAADRARVAEWRLKNPEKEKAARDASRQRARAAVAEYKSSRGCESCGIKDHRVLDLHHRDRSSKVAAVSQLISRASAAALAAEMEKCKVLCANCHRIEHYEEAQSSGSGGVFFRAS